MAHLDAELADLDRGYALWFGAGVTAHLCAAAGVAARQWAGLVQLLEAAAGIVSPVGTFSERLELCLRAIGRDAFQRALRTSLLDPVFNAVHGLGNHATQVGAVVPDVARRLAALGQLASPIASFNIESETSSIVGGCAGTYRLLPFLPPVPDSVADLQLHSFGNTGKPEPARIIHHPHGVLDLTGICVLAESDYESMNGTLALQLAIHLAFQRTLVIVGMSMDDEYLREQLRAFRPHIQRVKWFVCGEIEAEKREWATLARIEVVDVGAWADFWAAVDRRFGSLVDGRALACAWHGRFEKACFAVRGRNQLGEQSQFQRAKGAPLTAVLKWTRLALLAGEPYTDPAAAAVPVQLSGQDAATLAALHDACHA